MGIHPARLFLAISLFIPPLLLQADAGVQPSQDERLAKAMGLPTVRDNGVEIRVWVWSNLRVQPVYRVLKSGDVVSVEKLAWTEVVRATRGGYNEAEARRETRENRQLLQKEVCDGSIRETAEYLWCRTKLQRSDWSLIFDDLLPDELRTLPPPQPDRDCESLIVLDGESVRIEILEPGRRHAVEYAHPDLCCRTVACAIVNHVRSVVVQNVH